MLRIVMGNSSPPGCSAACIFRVVLLSFVFAFRVSTPRAVTVREVIATDRGPKAIGPYSQAVKANGFIFISGQIPLDPRTQELVEGDVARQTGRVMENLKGIVEAAGSSLDRVVKTTVFLKDLADFPAMNEVYSRSFPAYPPARATVQETLRHSHV